MDIMQESSGIIVSDLSCGFAPRYHINITSPASAQIRDAREPIIIILSLVLFIVINLSFSLVLICPFCFASPLLLTLKPAIILRTKVLLINTVLKVKMCRNINFFEMYL